MKNTEYLKLLARQYPCIGDVTTELINLKAILNLPKGTEHFLTDIHGEYVAFSHHLRTASGVMRFKVDDIFGHTLSNREKKMLAILIAYPEERLKILKAEGGNHKDWYQVNIHRLITICKLLTSKYTRSKVRKALPKDFAYILDELLHIEISQLNQEGYYNQIINTVIELERADDFIIAICKVMQQLAVDRLHIIGDIYDRGPYPHKVMDRIMAHHDTDIQWGNHDILWMGAANGHPLMVATTIRIALRYANLECLEEGYGINLLPLGQLAMEVYGNDPCSEFMPKLMGNEEFYAEKDKLLIARMHKAISIIQFKLEGHLLKSRPDFAMDDRDCLNRINYEKGTFSTPDGDYLLTSNFFPTIDPADPLVLTADEQAVIDKLTFYFLNSEKLQRHIRFFYTNGSLYLTCNGNLLIHGCIVLDDEGQYQKLNINGTPYEGQAMLDKFDELVRQAQYTKSSHDTDWLWYLWTGPKSPMFAKQKMATFERYFLKEKAQHKEKLNAYFKLREHAEICQKILSDFGLDPDNGHIISGHTPVKEAKGESPIKADGRLLVIDGGLSRPYQSTTGIGGYTLIYNSWGLRLVSHKPFSSIEQVIKEGLEVNSDIRVLKKTHRKRVMNTDAGLKIKEEIKRLKQLLQAYRNGQVPESQVD